MLTYFYAKQDGDRTKHQADFNIKLETNKWVFCLKELLSTAVDSFVHCCVHHKQHSIHCYNICLESQIQMS